MVIIQGINNKIIIIIERISNNSDNEEKWPEQELIYLTFQ